MLSFLSLNIEGFCSILEKTSLQLNKSEVVFIKAPYGSGKTTIFSALTWCLYGKDLKGVSDVNTWKKYRPDNYLGTCVTVSFQNNGVVYKVIRCQNYKGVLDDGNKGYSRLLLYKDGYCSDVKGKLKIQSEIESALGLTYTLFMNSIMFGQGLKRLIQEPNSDKKKLFEEIFDLSFLNLAKNLANEERNDVNTKVRDLESKLDSLTVQLKNDKETYNKLRKQEKHWEAITKDKELKLKAKRLKLTKDLIKAKKPIKEVVERGLNIKISRVEKRLKGVNANLATSKSRTELDLATFVSKILNLLKNKKYDRAYKKLQLLHDTFKEILEYQEEKTELIEKRANLKVLLSKYLRNKSICEGIADNICDIDNQILSLHKEKPKTLSPTFRNKLKIGRKQYKKLKSIYRKELSKLEDYNWLISDPLGNNGIKAYLFDSSLSIINTILEGYSNILGFKISFEVDLDSVRKDFVTLIERDGVIIDYNELSGGEKSLCNLSMALAMNEALTASRGINIAFLDEVFEGLSDDGVELAIALINNIFEGKTLYIISHHESLPLSNARIMQVEKHKGISRIL